jgi:hypothetical protein
MTPVERYKDLPPITRALIENLTANQIAKLVELLGIYERMPPQAMDFLERADPKTLEWLQKARPEEIAQLDEGIGLVRAFRTVGKFVKWALIAMIGAFLGMVAVVSGIGTVLTWFKPGK